MPDKYYAVITWLAVAGIVAMAYHRFPLSSPYFGDEDYYVNEAAYLAKAGVIQALSQGTSLVLSLLILAVSRLFCASLLVGARILSVIAFAGACPLFLKCTRRFSGLSMAQRYFALLCFAMLCSGWLWRGLADVVSVAFLLAVYYWLTASYVRLRYALAGIFLLFAFAVKPVVMMMVPGMVLLAFLNGHKEGVSWQNRSVRTILFTAVFGLCFILYHVPGYLAFHKVMLESKDHHYEASGVRIENHNSWGEKNVYFEVYNPQHKPNKWAVTWGEVDSFKQQHPDVQLNLGYSEFVKVHPAVWLRNISNKLFLYLPYSIQSVFFFSKWTVVNHWVKNILVIQLVALLLIAFVYWRERDFVREYGWLLLPSLLYFVLLSCYTIPQLEDNWLIFSIAFLALPVMKSLFRQVNTLLLFALQIVFVCL